MNNSRISVFNCVHLTHQCFGSVSYDTDPDPDLRIRIKTDPDPTFQWEIKFYKLNFHTFLSELFFLENELIFRKRQMNVKFQYIFLK